jgi:hypothetical protein
LFGALLAAQQLVKERALVAQVTAVFEDRLKAEREAIAKMTAEQLQVEQARRHVVEQLLTLKCPHCRAAFLDFQNCFALTCHRCDCRFCAYCLTSSGLGAAASAASHNHVAQCAFNPPQADGTRRYSAEPGREVQRFEDAQRERRKRAVDEYLGSLGLVEVAAGPGGQGRRSLRSLVVAACAQDFADLGIEVHLDV